MTADILYKLLLRIMIKYYKKQNNYIFDKFSNL